MKNYIKNWFIASAAFTLACGGIDLTVDNNDKTDGRTTEVECDDWRPEEPPEEGCGGVALFPLWLLAGRRRSASR